MPIRRPGAYVALGLASLVLAALSLPLAAGPAYDPWAWIVWGREILHFGLVTTGGPTWKPLPVIFTTLFAPFGSAAPDLWLVVARAGGIMALGLAALLAVRLVRMTAGGRGAAEAPAALAGGAAGAPAALAGVLAGAGLLTLYQFGAGVATGGSEGLLVALTLLAILRHLDGEPRQALALAFAAALLRPEAWPFLALYGIWLWRRDPGARVLIAALLALVPVLWFVPELWGSGSLARGVEWAQYPREGSAAFARCPFCSEISGTAWPLLTLPFKVGLALALGSAAVLGPPRRAVAVLGPPRVAVAVVVCLGLVWVLEEAVLTQIGFSGSDRYLTAPLALLIVAGATGWGLVLARWPRTALVAAVATIALSLVALGRGPHFSAQLASVRDQASIRRDMAAAVAKAGGPAQLLVCGAVQTNPSEAPLAAWTLGAALRRTESTNGSVLIQSPSAASSALLPVSRTSYHLVAADGSVRIFARCHGAPRA